MLASAYAAALRAHLAPFWLGRLGAPQLGVAIGGGTAYVVFTSRLVFAWAQVRKVSGGRLVADVKGAL